METKTQALTVNLPSENVWTIPNMLSGYRLLIAPFILWLIVDENASLFAVFICISLVTDALDGIIARAFNMITRLGARLDSVADVATYMLAIGGGLMFQWESIRPDVWMLYVFAVTYVCVYVIALIKFQKFPSLHLYSSKVGGYLQGIFFFVLFAYQYVPWLYFLALGWGVLSYLEEMAVILLLPELRSNCKGLFWLVR